MWEAIAGFAPQELDAADRRYRDWARSRVASGTLLGFIVETEASEPVASGCLWLMPIQPRPGWKSTTAPYLMSMYTEPSHREKGLATRIVRESLHWARAQGCDMMILHASRFGEKMYLREGFRWTLEMRRRLDQPGPKRPRRRRQGRTRRR